MSRVGQPARVTGAGCHGRGRGWENSHPPATLTRGAGYPNPLRVFFCRVTQVTGQVPHRRHRHHLQSLDICHCHYAFLRLSGFPASVPLTHAESCCQVCQAASPCVTMTRVSRTSTVRTVSQVVPLWLPLWFM